MKLEIGERWIGVILVLRFTLGSKEPNNPKKNNNNNEERNSETPDKIKMAIKPSEMIMWVQGVWKISLATGTGIGIGVEFAADKILNHSG